MQQAHSELCKQLETELTSLRGELHTSQEKLTEEQRHYRELQDLMCSETNNLQNELAAKEEAMKKVETEVQLLQETVDSLQETQEKMEREHKAQLEAVQGMYMFHQSLALSMCTSLCCTHQVTANWRVVH